MEFVKKLFCVSIKLKNFIITFVATVYVWWLS